MKLKLTKEPVTRLACAIRAPEPLGSLTWCYVPIVISLILLLLPQHSLAQGSWFERYWVSDRDATMTENDWGMNLKDERPEVYAKIHQNFGRLEWEVGHDSITVTKPRLEWTSNERYTLVPVAEHQFELRFESGETYELDRTDHGFCIKLATVSDLPTECFKVKAGT